MKKEAKKRHNAIIIPTKEKATSTQDYQILFFKIPTFQGGMLQGDTIIEDANRYFRSAAMTRYLESKTYCDNSPCWSGAFASQVQESIASNDIISFIATELKHENSYYQVWTKFIKYLTTSNITTARVMSHWKVLFRLKC